MFTPIVIAGLQRQYVRRQAMRDQLENKCIMDAQFAADIGLTVDWRDWKQADIHQLATRTFPWCMPESNNPWWNRNLKLGEIACTLTHWNIWTYAFENCFHRLIVMEDDAALLSGFEDREQIIASLSDIDPSWDFLYLGRERLEPDRATFDRFTQPGFSYCSHGYVLSHKGIRSLLDTALPDCIIPVDEFLPAMYLNHPRDDVCARFPPRISAYGLTKDLVDVKSDSNWGSDTENSPYLAEQAKRALRMNNK